METFKCLLIVLIRVLQRNRTVRYERFIIEELVHEIMEAEKVPWSSASSRPKKASGVIYSEAEDLRTRELEMNSRTGKNVMWCASSTGWKKRHPPPPHLLFYIGPQEIGQSSTTWREAVCFSEFTIQMLISPGNILTDLSRNILGILWLTQVDT